VLPGVEDVGLEVEVDVVELWDVVVGAAVVVGVVEVEVLDELLVDLLLLVELPVSLLPASKTTMLALWPLGTVTTQNAAPPAPSELSAEVTSFKALTEGSILHGRPLQPAPSSQVISTPKVAGVSRNGVAAS
jgi:hypothetical protein